MQAAMNAAALQEARGRHQLSEEFFARAAAADERSTAIKARLAEIG